MRPRVPFGVLVVLLAGAALAPTARAALPVKPITISVNSTGDAGDIDLSDDVCKVALHGVTCTLRAAIQTANHHAETTGRDTIKFAIGTGQKTIQSGSDPTATTPRGSADAPRGPS